MQVLPLYPADVSVSPEVINAQTTSEDQNEIKRPDTMSLAKQVDYLRQGGGNTGQERPVYILKNFAAV